MNQLSTVLKEKVLAPIQDAIQQTQQGLQQTQQVVAQTAQKNQEQDAILAQLLKIIQAASQPPPGMPGMLPPGVVPIPNVNPQTSPVTAGGSSFPNQVA